MRHQATVISSPLTVTVLAANGAGAGPPWTEPSAIEYLLPWHGQLIVPSLTVETVQPWCVHTAVKALNCPAVGWVTTTFWVSNTLPPPTGLSDVLADTPAAPGLSPWSPLSGVLVPPSGVLSPQPASTATAPSAAAPASTARRVVSVMTILRSRQRSPAGRVRRPPGDRTRAKPVLNKQGRYARGSDCPPGQRCRNHPP